MSGVAFISNWMSQPSLLPDPKELAVTSSETETCPPAWFSLPTNGWIDIANRYSGIEVEQQMSITNPEDRAAYSPFAMWLHCGQPIQCTFADETKSRCRGPLIYLGRGWRWQMGSLCWVCALLQIESEDQIHRHSKGTGAAECSAARKEREMVVTYERHHGMAGRAGTPLMKSVASVP